jgi:hypothetical protein
VLNGAIKLAILASNPPEARDFRFQKSLSSLFAHEISYNDRNLGLALRIWHAPNLECNFLARHGYFLMNPCSRTAFSCFMVVPLELSKTFKVAREF